MYFSLQYRVSFLVQDGALLNPSCLVNLKVQTQILKNHRHLLSRSWKHSKALQSEHTVVFFSWMVVLKSELHDVHIWQNQTIAQFVGFCFHMSSKINWSNFTLITSKKPDYFTGIKISAYRHLGNILKLPFYFYWRTNFKERYVGCFFTDRFRGSMYG